MKEATNKELKEFLNKQGIQSAKYLGDWNGYKVYKPDLSNFGFYIGVPTYILQRETELRLTDYSEGMNIFDWYLGAKEHIDSDDDEEMQPVTNLTGLGEK